MLRCVFFCCGIVVLQQSPGGAQIRTLHVADFSMSVDRSTLPLGDDFHLTIRARVAEPVASLDEVVLPNLAAFEELGDERRCTTARGGTECLETLTLEALTSGDVTIGPASLDAVDGRNGRPSRFQTNTLLLHVTGAPLGFAMRAAVVQTAWLAARIAIFFGLLIAAALALGWLRSRSRRARLHVMQAKPAMPARAPDDPSDDADARLRELVRALAHDPSRARAEAVRTELRSRAGARADETLSDLACRGALQGEAGAALSAIERASFCEEQHVCGAVLEALPYLS